MGLTVRGLTAGELELVQPLTHRAFGDLDTRHGRPVRTVGAAEDRWNREVDRHLLATGRCLGAFDGDQLVGVAESSVRGHLWQLALLVVEPGRHGQGVGRALLEASLDGAPQVRTFASSRDSQAMRLYARAGFRLLPALWARGVVEVERLGDATGCREADVAADAERVGLAHLAGDLAFLQQRGTRVLVSERGCAIADGRGVDGWARVLSAGSPREGQRLLRAGLAAVAAPGRTVMAGQLTPQQDWAVEVALEARMELAPCGPVAVSGVDDPLSGTCPVPAVLV